VRKRKTELLSVVARKLAPFIFLFGVYLVTFGHISPGGGFQGGVVIASGLILLVLSERQRGSDIGRGRMGLGEKVLTAGESIGFALLLIIGSAGLVLAGFFLANPVPNVRFLGSDRVAFVFALNVIIGVKVSAGVGLIAVVLFREEES
jgi:multicomponent Na+:H+ antiporter subunit B